MNILGLGSLKNDSLPIAVTFLEQTTILTVAV